MEMKGLSDTQLVRFCQDGHKEAFNELVIRHQDKIFNAALRFLNNYDDAEEVAQRAFINAFKNIHRFKGEATFSTWIYRIVFNEAMTLKREYARSKTISLHQDNQNGHEVMGEQPVHEVPDPLAQQEAKERSEQIQRALSQLDAHDRQLIILKDIEGFSYDEISQVMNLPRRLIGVKLHRARAQLREKLSRLIGDNF
jgi:RNA polymerase sigma-70 factor (ECF subfamily)